MRNLFIISVLIVFLLPAKSQFRVKKPVDLYKQGLYHQAIELFDKKAKKKKSRRKLSEAHYYKAMCYYKLSDYKRAEIYFSRAFRSNPKNKKILLPYSEVLKINEKFNESKQYLEVYKQFHPNDTTVPHRMRAIDFAQEMMNSPTRFTVNNEMNLNTSKNDFVSKYSDNNFDYLYFSSTRDESTGKKLDMITGHKFSDIYYSELDSDGDWMNPVKIGELVNSEFNEGAPAFNSMGSKMFFTRCSKEKNKNLGCKIFVSERETDEWMAADSIMTLSDSVSVGHATISEDELRLYFASSMEGGVGGLDIWMVERASAGENWGIPENLGKVINTPGNESTPYIRPNGDLYFASDYHRGMGGKDIFRAYKDSVLEWHVENMGYPINSTADDFGIVFKGETDEGFLTSNRAGGKGGDDLWSFVYPPIEYRIKGLILNEKTRKREPNTSVRLIGTDGTYMRTTIPNGKYDFKIKSGWEYIVVAYKENFLKSKVRISTIGLEDGKLFSENINLTPVNEDVEIPNILYEFGSWELNDIAKKELSKLVIKLKDNPTASIELSSHTDMVGSDEANQELSQKRANSVFEYLKVNGVDEARIVPKGYGETKPKVVDEGIYESVNEVFPVGSVLSPEFIENLKTDQLKALANQINRRTEFRVLSVE